MPVKVESTAVDLNPPGLAFIGLFWWLAVIKLQNKQNQPVSAIKLDSFKRNGFRFNRHGMFVGGKAQKEEATWKWDHRTQVRAIRCQEQEMKLPEGSKTSCYKMQKQDM